MARKVRAPKKFGNPNCWDEHQELFLHRVKADGYWSLYLVYYDLVYGEQGSLPECRQAWKIVSPEFPPDEPPTQRVYDRLKGDPNLHLGLDKKQLPKPSPTEEDRARGDRAEADMLADGDVHLSGKVLDHLSEKKDTGDYTDVEIAWAAKTATKLQFAKRKAKDIDWKAAPSLKAAGLARFAWQHEVDFHRLFSKHLLPKADQTAVDVRKDIDDHDAVIARLDAEFKKAETEGLLAVPVELPN